MKRTFSSDGAASTSRTALHETEPCGQTTSSTTTQVKRRRVENQAGTICDIEAQLGPRHVDLWFDDGSIILAARGMSFKVHQSVLAPHSLVFRRLFDEMKTMNPQVYEGCPVLWLADYGPDVAKLLLVLYGSDRVYMNHQIPIEFTNLRPVTLLALKYDIQDIVDDAVNRLKISFPAVVDDEAYWDDPVEHTRHGPNSCVRCEDRDLVAVVGLAKALQCPSVQVIALYHCCRLEAGVLFDGVTYPDDAQVHFSRDELRMCASATDRLYQHNTHVMNSLTEMYASPADVPRIIPCRTSAACHKALGLLIAHGLQNAQFASPCALEHLDRWIDENSGICFGCRAALKVVVNERREEAFDALGDLFGIEPWPPVHM